MIKSHHLRRILCLWGVAFFTLLYGCTKAPSSGSAPVADKQTAEVFAMDTVMDLTVYGDASVLKSAEGIITDLEHKFSVTDENSDIYRLNRDKQAEVSSDTLELISFAKGVSDRTGGALDITVYPIVKAWGFTTGEYRIPSADELHSLLAAVDYKSVQTNGSTVALPADSMLDLGSVAKGYTGDRLIDHFRENGITSAIVSLGGNVQTLGTKPDGSPWRVGIADPFGGEYAGALSVQDKCVITSGSYQRFFEEGGVRYHHIIDPSTGSPAEGGFVSVTVVGDKGALCDALSTALFVMGKDKAFDFCSANSVFDALFIDEDGRIYITAGIAEAFTPSGSYTNADITVIGTEEAEVCPTELPVLSITSSTPYANVGNNYVEIKMELSSNTHSSGTLYDGPAYIHLRGNSTAGLSKKPFRLKLGSKADLLGMGANRHWVLLANAIDLTNIRNLTLQNLAGKLGLDYMSSELVELYYNGDYKGVYQLCEHVRIGKSRVNIYDWSDLAEDVADAVTDDFLQKGIFTAAQENEAREGILNDLKRDYSWTVERDKTFYLTTVRNIAGREHWKVDLADYCDFSAVPEATGGALIEMDFYHRGNADLKTAYKLPLYITSPDYTESAFPALENNLREYIQAMEYAMHSTDFVFRNSDEHYYTTDEGQYRFNSGKRTGTAYAVSDFSSPAYDGRHYTDFVDIDSVINNMLVCEISDNWDCMKNSFFMYKDISSKIFFGPVWDFDWAWGNSMYHIDTAGLWKGTYTQALQWQTTNEYFANEQYYQTQQFNRLLIRDPYFVVKLYERYREIRNSIILPFHDNYAKLCNALTDYNIKNAHQWARTDSCGGGAGYTYKEQLVNTLKFIDQRIEWLDRQFTDPDTLISSLGYYRASDCLFAEKPDLVSSEGNALITVNVAGTIAKNTARISFQVNGTTFLDAPVEDGKATVSIPFDTLKKDNGNLSVIVFRAVDAEGKYIGNRVGTISGVYTNAHSNYILIDKRDLTPAASDPETNAVSR